METTVQREPRRNTQERWRQVIEKPIKLVTEVNEKMFFDSIAYDEDAFMLANKNILQTDVVFDHTPYLI